MKPATKYECMMLATIIAVAFGLFFINVAAGLGGIVMLITVVGSACVLSSMEDNSSNSNRRGL